MTSTTSAPRLRVAEATKGPRWLVLALGIATVVLGIWLLANPAATLLALVLFLGVYWIVRGVFTLASLLSDQTMWGWKLFIGVVGIAAGLSVINTPLWSALFIPSIAMILLGSYGVVAGCIEVYQAIRGGGWGIGILGALNVLFGLILLANPLIGVALLPWLLGIIAVADGIGAIIFALRMR